jgi:hypothetical protein
VPAAASRLRQWAGRSLVALALLHLVVFLTESVRLGHLQAWLTGDLLTIATWDEQMSQSQAYFWESIGSFAVPVLLVGLIVEHLARAGLPVPRWLTGVLAGWLVVCSLFLEPSGFPLGLVPVALLLRAHRLDRRLGEVGATR